MFCPLWTLSAHSSISTYDVIFGTVADVRCDDGFMFPHGKLVQSIECISDEEVNPEAIWNVSSLTCQGTFSDRTSFQVCEVR
jgi:hypothetical protein